MGAACTTPPSMDRLTCIYLGLASYMAPSVQLQTNRRSFLAYVFAHRAGLTPIQECKSDMLAAVNDHGLVQDKMLH